MQFMSQINEISKYAYLLKKGDYMQLHMHIIRGLVITNLK